MNEKDFFEDQDKCLLGDREEDPSAHNGSDSSTDEEKISREKEEDVFEIRANDPFQEEDDEEGDDDDDEKEEGDVNKEDYSDVGLKKEVNKEEEEKEEEEKEEEEEKGYYGARRENGGEEDFLESIGLKREIEKAEKRIRKYIRETPLVYSLYLSQLSGCEVYLKFESAQITGSFKLRGALNKILSLSKKERKTILVTASSGNHGAAFAYAVKKFGLKGMIYLPGYTTKAKIDALKDYDVVLKFFGTDCVKTEEHARGEAEKNNLLYIPPYNDLKIIAGHGTIGIELRRQIDKIDIVFVPVGGGGLISGIIGYLKPVDKNIKIIGCQPLNSPVMYKSVRVGKIIEMESKPTLSDGSAGGIEKGSITFDICKKYVDDFVLVSEQEIKEAMRLMIEKHFSLVEGAGALSVASFLQQKEIYKRKTVVLVLSGSKIALAQLKEVIS
ncbi:MAG: threonine/serine dehydratase [Candidatus Aminicenantes bacterium]|nr:threonine/serine dehydratase [Candidatus Aminicenantes bacterium]MDH5705728.1 threonine/serine dehydratase [Candidatus Aminicenantes bacterium]